MGSAFGRIALIAAVGMAFLLGLAGTVYLSLRSPEVVVPNLIGQNRSSGEAALGDVGLLMRVRATRYSSDASPNTILDQSPRAGEVIKAGQKVAVVVSRSEIREGEAAQASVAVGDDVEESNVSSNDSDKEKPAAEKNSNAKDNKESVRSKRETTNKNVNKQANNRNANNQNATLARENRNSNTTRSGNLNIALNRNSNASSRNANQNINRNVNSAPVNTNRRVAPAPPPVANRNVNKSP